MTEMKQKGTDYGLRGETGEREPKGVNSSDTSGERKEKTCGGVAMGKADSIRGREAGHYGMVDGRKGEMNDGNRGERNVYDHKRHGKK